MIKIASPRRVRRARIEIVPLIDIIFFLLASFIVLSLSMIQGRGLEVALPSAKAGRSVSGDGAVVISIASDGALYIDGQAGSLSEITAEASRLKPLKRNFIIRADKRSSAESLVSVLDSLGRSGVSAASIQTTVADE